MDFEKIEANTFQVTDEFVFSNGTPPDIRTDVNFFINDRPGDLPQRSPLGVGGPAQAGHRRGTGTLEGPESREAV
jgi:hypothetical protein